MISYSFVQDCILETTHGKSQIKDLKPVQLEKMLRIVIMLTVHCGSMLIFQYAYDTGVTRLHPCMSGWIYLASVTHKVTNKLQLKVQVYFT